MTQYAGATFTGTAKDPGGTAPFSQPHGAKVSAKLRCTTEKITYASQLAGSTFYVGTLPRGAIFKGIELNADTSSGSTTLAFGTSGSAASHAAAAALTATDTPTVRGKCSAFDDEPLAADTDIFMTTAAATAPASGTLMVGLRFATLA